MVAHFFRDFVSFSTHVQMNAMDKTGCLKLFFFLYKGQIKFYLNKECKKKISFFSIVFVLNNHLILFKNNEANETVSHLHRALQPQNDFF